MERLQNYIHFLILCIVDFKGYGSKQNPFYMCQTLIFQEALYYWKRTLDTTFRAYCWAHSIVSQYRVSLSWQVNLRKQKQKHFVCAWCFIGNKSYLILRLSTSEKKLCCCYCCCLFRGLSIYSKSVHLVPKQKVVWVLIVERWWGCGYVFSFDNEGHSSQLLQTTLLTIYL